MATLYEISEDLRSLDELLADCGGELTPENEGAINAWFDELDSAVASKTEGYIHLIKELDARAKAMKAEAEEFRHKAQVESNKVKSLKNRLLTFMDERGLPEIVTDHFKVNVTPNGGVQPIDVVDDLVPESFKYIPPPQVNIDKIRDALKSGEELKFASLRERGTHLRIR